MWTAPPPPPPPIQTLILGTAIPYTDLSFNMVPDIRRDDCDAEGDADYEWP